MVTDTLAFSAGRLRSTLRKPSFFHLRVAAFAFVLTSQRNFPSYRDGI